MRVTHEAYDPGTGELTYAYVTDTNGFPPDGVISATDYDTEMARPWRSYTIQFVFQAGNEVTTTPESITSVSDDGSSFTFENVFFYTLGGFFAVDYGDRITSRDALGRVEYVAESFTDLPTPSGRSEFLNRTTDWNAMTGKGDYRVTLYRDGRMEAVDYDAATGNADYAVTTYGDGRVRAVDHDATTGNADYAVTAYGNGRVVTEDFDSATGRLDYSVDRAASGAHVDTDHDQDDAYAWTTYTVSYAADGSVLNVVVA